MDGVRQGLRRQRQAPSAAISTNYYRDAPFQDRHIDLFRRYFQALAEAEGPVLIHCAAGKDRTGLLAALTHHLMGVERDDIFADYLLTNALARHRGATAAGDADDRGAVRPYADGRRPCAPRWPSTPATWRPRSTPSRRATAGLDAYLEDELGVDAALRAAIEARLLD